MNANSHFDYNSSFPNGFLSYNVQMYVDTICYLQRSKIDREMTSNQSISRPFAYYDLRTRLVETRHYIASLCV